MTKPFGSEQRRKRQGVPKQANLLIFALLVMGLVYWGAYYFFLPKSEKFTLSFYTYAEVNSQDFVESLTVRDTVVPKRVAVIEPRVAGTIEEIYVREGQDVKQGEPLLRLYSQEVVDEKNAIETELGEARAKLTQLGIDQELETEAERAKIVQAREQLSMAESQLELQEVLYGYGAIPRVELEKAEQNLEIARRSITQSERELELLARKHEVEQAAILRNIAVAEEKLAKLQEKIDSFLVTAPFSGRVLALNIPHNRLVTAYQGLGELADLSSQVVELHVAPGQTERFGLGTPVSISLGQNEYSGQVAYIAPQAQQGQDGVAVAVQVEFLEEVSHVKPNSTVNADIHLAIHPASLSLPRGAYLSSGQQLFVYVIEQGVAKKRDVQFGLLQGNSVQILQGLDLGEKVIISSYDAFRHLDEVALLPDGGHAL